MFELHEAEKTNFFVNYYFDKKTFDADEERDDCATCDLYEFCKKKGLE